MVEPDSRRELDRLLRRRRRRRRLLFALGTPLAVWIAATVWVYASGAAYRVPSSIRQSGDIRAMAEAMRRTRTNPASERLPPPVTGRDPFLLPEGATIDSTAPTPMPADALVEAAGAWVAMLNSFNPHLFLHHDVDAYGNLYVIPGPWFYELKAMDYPYVIDLYAGYWQQYLREAAGEFPQIEAGGLRLQPGIIMFDCKGEVSRRMDGVVRVLRLPDRDCALSNPDVR